VLVVVTADPATSPRAAEALRIALGLRAGECDVAVALTGPAVRVLGADAEDLVDGEDLGRHLAALRRLGQVIHAEGEGLPPGPGWNPHDFAVRPLDPPTLAGLVAGSRRTLVF
jgi:hypothetical protein